MKPESREGFGGEEPKVSLEQSKQVSGLALNR